MTKYMEEYRTIESYPNYQVSNLGNVKSLKKYRGTSERVLVKSTDSRGYSNVCIFENKIKKTRTVHQLVAEAFLGHNPCGHKLVVNHKNFNRTDNRLENLEIVTQRVNTDLKHRDSTSQYVGVSWITRENKWVAQIVTNGKTKFLGYFSDEVKASECYLEALSYINKHNK